MILSLFHLFATVLSRAFVVFGPLWLSLDLTVGASLKQTNLLFIMYDDLRPELSIYGRNHMITPNFERLANKSVVFDQAHCQISVCNPSRDSMLTGNI